MVGGVHDKFANKNDLQGWAVDEHALVSFCCLSLNTI